MRDSNSRLTSRLPFRSRIPTMPHMIRFSFALASNVWSRRLQRRDQTFEARAKEKRIMCGIVGILDLNGRRDVSRELLSRINEAQHHRGPDECGLHVEPGVGLGHRRLSIIDVSTGQQPLWNEDRSVVVVYN